MVCFSNLAAFGRLFYLLYRKLNSWYNSYKKSIESGRVRLPLTILVSVEVTYFGLAQTDIIPPDLLSIFIQLPLIGLFAWYVLKKDRDTREWIDHLMVEKDKQHAREMELQEKRCNRSIDLFEKIVDKQDNRQADLISALATFEKTLTLNTATVSESIRLSELIDELKKTIGE